jgi:hypothetical protein
LPRRDAAAVAAARRVAFPNTAATSII